MKKINTLLIVVAALFFAACDPEYTCDSAIINYSGHQVRITPLNYTVYTSAYDSSIHDTAFFSSVIDLSDEDNVIVSTTGGIGYASREECISNMRRYLGDSVQLLFENNKRVVFRSSDTTGVSPYNFNSAIYSYVQDLRVNRDKVGDPYYGKLTLLIGDNFYQLAQ